MNYYRIQKGDSLASIAKKFNTSIEELENLNSRAYLNDLRVGMDIIIPKNQDQYFSVYNIEAGDSLYKIARKYNINPELLASLNGLDMEDYIYPNQELLIPKSGYSYYITAEGDTLDTVSDMFKTSKENVLRNNPTIYLLKDQVLVNKR